MRRRPPPDGRIGHSFVACLVSLANNDEQPDSRDRAGDEPNRRNPSVGVDGGDGRRERSAVCASGSRSAARSSIAVATASSSSRRFWHHSPAAGVSVADTRARDHRMRPGRARTDRHLRPCRRRPRASRRGRSRVPLAASFRALGRVGHLTGCRALAAGRDTGSRRCGSSRRRRRRRVRVGRGFGADRGRP